MEHHTHSRKQTVQDLNRRVFKSFLVIITCTLALLSCQSRNNEKQKKETKTKLIKTAILSKAPINNTSLILSKKHKPNLIVCDLDGDDLADTVKMVQNRINRKYGLEIIFGSRRIARLGMGKDILGQGFDDLDWVGIFEKASKGETYWNNVNDDGEIIADEEVKEEDKIKLPHDGIFIHQAESCGGGVIYLKKGKFDWIQQE